MITTSQQDTIRAFDSRSTTATAAALDLLTIKHKDFGVEVKSVGFIDETSRSLMREGEREKRKEKLHVLRVPRTF